MTTYVLYECGQCDHLHPWDWNGDCREDENRYAGVEDYEERTGVSEFGPDGRLQIIVRSMSERVAADLA